MKVYTGTKKVQAQPMTRGDYNALRGWETPKEENPSDEGYLIEYLDGGKANHDAFDGYISWSPRDVFERSYLETGEPVVPSDGPKVVYGDLIAMIASEVFVVPSGSTTTICHITLKNGFSVQGISACVDPANYRQNVGEFFARKQAIDKIWPFAGFLLAEKLYQEKKLQGDWIDRLRDEHELNAGNLTKLKKFLANLPEGFDKVKAEMMHEQARIMGQFVDILKMRLDNALLG
ncbi:hypothetical protein CNR35_00038 [Pseudomonas phage inbricus]|uniref:Uncharacterized protein n=2 Tax=Inbricusvirus inbricus TaxID=2845970 RepID=A0A514CUN5_9CAUD|nr:hypothetical protein KMC58_gp38 [Pseudomonas phage inbricus]ATW58134.1 hypothetical protein CNR35_00038 [Pseudomonas phage inbricus]QDH84185.1 hypothetical protein Axy13_069 [Achromobacter phage vB_AxyP_19-32_Axy13]